MIELQILKTESDPTKYIFGNDIIRKINKIKRESNTRNTQETYKYIMI